MRSGIHHVLPNATPSNGPKSVTAALSSFSLSSALVARVYVLLAAVHTNSYENVLLFGCFCQFPFYIFTLVFSLSLSFSDFGSSVHWIYFFPFSFSIFIISYSCRMLLLPLPLMMGFFLLFFILWRSSSLYSVAKYLFFFYQSFFLLLRFVCSVCECVFLFLHLLFAFLIFICFVFDYRNCHRFTIPKRTLFNGRGGARGIKREIAVEWVRSVQKRLQR